MDSVTVIGRSSIAAMPMCRSQNTFSSWDHALAYAQLTTDGQGGLAVAAGVMTANVALSTCCDI